MKYNFKKKNFKKSFLTGITIMSLGLQLMPFSTVNASGDKVKPVIKLKGQKNITVEMGKKFKVPKVTAKDNKDGNVTKKITLKLSAPGLKSKQKKSIIKSIQKNKQIVFNKEGKYTITYTVKDSSGNKATKKRYITVVSPKKEEQTTEITTSTTEFITPEVTTEVKQETTEKKEETTEVKTTEAPVKEEKTTETKSTESTSEEEEEEEIHDEEEEDVRKGVATVNGKTVSIDEDGADYSDFDCREEEINGKTYTIISDEDFKKLIYKSQFYTKDMNINVENRIDTFFVNYDSPMSENSSYLKFFGNINATDAEGNDISENIAIYEPEVFESNSPDSDAIYDRCIMYCVDSEGRGCIYNYYLSFRGNQEYLASKYTKVNDDPFVYVSYKSDVAENKNTNAKVLVMKNQDLYMDESRKNQA